VAAAAATADAGVILKLIPGAHPVTTNAVAVAVGGTLLLALSLATGERWELPRSEDRLDRRRTGLALGARWCSPGVYLGALRGSA
jgi:hypothetical protein